jgi:hypothetical protein
MDFDWDSSPGLGHINALDIRSDFFAFCPVWLAFSLYCVCMDAIEGGQHGLFHDIHWRNGAFPIWWE